MVGPSFPDVGRKPIRCDCCSGSCNVGPSLAFQAAEDIDRYGRVVDEKPAPRSTGYHDLSEVIAEGKAAGNGDEG